MRLVLLCFIAISPLFLLCLVPTKLIEGNSASFIKNLPDLPTVEKVAYGLPMRLSIPAIEVDSAFEYVGLSDGGEMAAPVDPDKVAWFNLGPRPGEKGSAVVAGHNGWTNGQGAVFDNLSKLELGDKLYVEDDQGAVIVFVVKKVRSYDSKIDSSSIFGSSDGKQHLNLITCAGSWDKVAGGYSKRMVIFTDKE